MRIRRGRGRWVLPPDVESSTLQPLHHPDQPHLQTSPPPPSTKNSLSLEQDALIGTGEDEGTANGKNPVARKYDCDPRSEIAADTDSSISSSSSPVGRWLEEEKALPLKKRRLLPLDKKGKEPSNATIDRELKNSNEITRAKRKRKEKIWTDYVLQEHWVADKECYNKTRNMNEIRCNRQNGKGWRCSLPAAAGRTQCQHHWTEQKKNARKK